MNFIQFKNQFIQYLRGEEIMILLVSYLATRSVWAVINFVDNVTGHKGMLNLRLSDLKAA